MRQPHLCDGCLEPIEDYTPYVGRDEFPNYGLDDTEDDSDPLEDEDYQFHFHYHEDARCEFAWVMRRIADPQE